MQNNIAKKSFKNGDAGLEIQHRMSSAFRYNQWVFDSIKPFLGKRLLETGSAIGNMTQLLFHDRDIVIAVDYDSKCVKLAKQKWQGQLNTKFLEYDVTSPEIKKS